MTLLHPRLWLAIARGMARQHGAPIWDPFVWWLTARILLGALFR